MYDVQTTLRIGETRPIFATLTASSTGTVTITSGTFQLLKSDLTAVDNSGSGGTNFSTPQSVTDFDAGASSTGGTRNAWYLLTATDTALLNVTDYYVGRFVLTGSASDSMARIRIVEVQIVAIY